MQKILTENSAPQRKIRTLRLSYASKLSSTQTTQGNWFITDLSKIFLNLNIFCTCECLSVMCMCVCECMCVGGWEG